MSDLRKLAEAATPGPWTAVARNKSREFHEIAIRSSKAHEWATSQTTIVRVPLMGGDIGHANAAYIAACSPERILRLLDVVGAAQRYVDSFTGEDFDALRTALEALKEDK